MLRQQIKWTLIAGILAYYSLLFVGSVFRPPTEQEREIERLGLPTEAVEITNLQNGWHAFSLALDGKKRRFLRRYESGIGGTHICVEIR